MEDRLNRHFKYLTRHNINIIEYISQHTLLANSTLFTQKKKRGTLYWTPRSILLQHPRKPNTTISFMYNLRFPFSHQYLNDILKYSFKSDSIILNHHPKCNLICSKLNLFQRILRIKKQIGRSPHFLKYLPTYEYPSYQDQFNKERDPTAIYILKKDIDRKEGLSFLYPGEPLNLSNKNTFLIQKFITNEYLITSPVNRQKYKVNFRFFVALRTDAKQTQPILFDDAFGRYTIEPFQIKKPMKMEQCITAYPISSARNTMKYHRSLGLPATLKEFKPLISKNIFHHLFSQVWLLVQESASVFQDSFQKYHQSIDKELNIKTSSYHLYALDIGLIQLDHGFIEPVLYEWNSNPSIYFDSDHPEESDWMKTVQQWWLSIL